MSLLYTFYGDDFTGSTDVLEQLATHGLPAVLFLAPPTPAQLAAFPRARVDAVDISTGALAVTRRNVRRLKLGDRVKVLRSNHFSALPPCRYHIIVSNPPYVGRAEMRALPREYAFEPRIALASGPDGLDSVRAIFAAAPRYLADQGILVVEVGNTERALMRAFPRLPFIWPEIAMGGGGVFILRAADLKEK